MGPVVPSGRTARLGELDDRRSRVRPPRLVARRAGRDARRLRAPLVERVAQGSRRPRLGARTGTRRRARHDRARPVRTARHAACGAEGRRPTTRPGRSSSTSGSGSSSSAERRCGLGACEGRRPCQSASLAAPPAPSARATARAARSRNRDRRSRRGPTRSWDGSNSPRPSAVMSSASSTSGSETYELRRTTWRPQARPEAKSSS